MSEVVVIVLAGLLVGGNVALAVVVSRILARRGRIEESGTPPTALVQPVPPVFLPATESHANALIGPTYNPLYDVSFRDLIEKRPSRQVLEQATISRTRNWLNALPEVGKSGLMVKEIVFGEDVMKVVFSESGQKKMASGAARLMKAAKDAGGLPILVDTKTGKILEQARLLPENILNAVNWGAVGMNAVHMIAGWDNARMLRQIDAKLDSLISSSKFENVSELEGIYELVREAYELPLHERAAWLNPCKVALKRLRGAWIRQIRSRIEAVKDPNEVNKLLFWMKSGVVAQGKAELSEQEEFIYFVMITLELEKLVCQANGHPEIFENVTLSTARRDLSEIVLLFKKKRALLGEHAGSAEERACPVEELYAQALLCIESNETKGALAG